MENRLNKTHTITSYNIVAGGHIIAGADRYLGKDPEQGYVIEVVPYDGQAAKAGVRLTDEKDWKDFADSKESGDNLPVIARICGMLETMLEGYAGIKDTLEIRKRKDVWVLSIEKNGRFRDLVMVFEYERFVNSSELFHPALFVHDMEEFDTWQFPLAADNDTIYTTIHPALKSPKGRRI